MYINFFIFNHKDPDNVAKINAWIALVNNPRKIKGIGITSGARDTKTATTNSSANILPKSLKLKDKGFVKSSNIFMGNKKGSGSTYLAKYPKINKTNNYYYILSKNY